MRAKIYRNIGYPMIIVPKNLPLVDRMKAEGIRVCDEIPEGCERPLRILILNLMPDKPSAEMELYHALDATTDRNVVITLAKMSNMYYRSTSQEYMDTFYEDVADIMERDEPFDGLLVNGAPFGHLEYEQVIYWHQLCVFFRWVDCRIPAHLYICWGAFARIFYNWGVRFVRIGFQWSGVYPHRILCKDYPIVDAGKEEMLIPVSRPCYLSHTELSGFKDLTIVAESPVTGPAVFVSEKRHQVFNISHSEYEASRLDFEYRRDTKAGLNPMIPYNYYEDDDPSKSFQATWHEDRDVLFRGWLENFVYKYEKKQ